MLPDRIEYAPPWRTVRVTEAVMTEPTARYVVASPRRSSQTVGNIGLYFACYRLFQLGWNVMPTPRNARGVDLIAYNHDALTRRGIASAGTARPSSKTIPRGLRCRGKSKRRHRSRDASQT